MASKYIFRRQFSSAIPLRLPRGQATHTAKAHPRDTPGDSTGVDKVQSNFNNPQIKADTSKAEAETIFMREVRLINARMIALAKDNRTALDEIRGMRDEVRDVKASITMGRSEAKKTRIDVGVANDEIRKVQDMLQEAKVEKQHKICKVQDYTQKEQDKIAKEQDRVLKVQKDIQEKDKILGVQDSIQEKDKPPALSDKDKIPANGKRNPSLPESIGNFTRAQTIDLLRFMDPNYSLEAGAKNPTYRFTLRDALAVASERHVDLRRYLDILAEKYGLDADMVQAATDIQPYWAKKYPELHKVVRSWR